MLAASLTSYKESISYILSYGLISCKRSIFCRIYSYFSRFLHIIKTLLNCSILYDSIECGPVKTIQNRIAFSDNCGSSRGIIQKGQFSKRLSRLICLEIFGLFACFHNPITIQFTSLNYIKQVPIITLMNYCLAWPLCIKITNLKCFSSKASITI